MAQRWAVVRLLDAGMHYAEISKRTGASTATVTRIASWLNHGEGGYREMLEQVQGRRRVDPLPARHRAMRERLRLAIPNKGRLLESTLGLLHDAGLVFEEHDRSLVARVQNHPLDILFVRTGDVIEFVNDGVADAGVTGGDILAESGVDLPVLRQLGYGRCRLVAADARRLTLRGDLGPRRRPDRHLAPQRHAPLLRGAGHPGRGHLAVRRGRGRPPARARGRDRGPRLDRLHARDERPAGDRRHPGVRGDPADQPRRPSASARRSSTGSSRCWARSSRPAAAST